MLGNLSIRRSQAHPCSCPARKADIKRVMSISKQLCRLQQLLWVVFGISGVQRYLHSSLDSQFHIRTTMDKNRGVPALTASPEAPLHRDPLSHEFYQNCSM